MTDLGMIDINLTERNEINTTLYLKARVLPRLNHWFRYCKQTLITILTGLNMTGGIGKVGGYANCAGGVSGDVLYIPPPGGGFCPNIPAVVGGQKPVAITVAAGELVPVLL